MKLVKKLSPKRLFGSKKSARSDFSSGSISSSSSEDTSVHKGRHVPESTTPVSVLPGDWSDTDAQFDLLRLRSSNSVDRDRSSYGVVSIDELQALLGRLGAELPASRDEAVMMLREAGFGCGGGEIDESCLRVDELIGRAGNEELREAFEFFDADGDGRITAEELMGAFKTALGEGEGTLEDCRRIIAEVDTNRDGFVCFEDFARMMQLQI